MSHAAQVREAARSLHAASDGVRAAGSQVTTAVESLAGLAGEVPDAWSAPPARRASEAVTNRMRRAASAGDALTRAAAELAALGEVGDGVAKQLARLEDHERQLQRRAVGSGDAAASASAAAAAVDVRRQIAAQLADWEERCASTARSVSSQSEVVRAAAREGRVTDALAYRGLVHSRTATRTGDVVVGSGLFASAWVRRQTLGAARAAHGVTAAGGAVLRDVGHVMTGRSILPRSTTYGPVLRAVGSAANLFTTPGRLLGGAASAWRALGERYAPQLRNATERMDRGRQLIRSGSQLSRFLGGPVRVLGVAADITVLRRGSSYTAARGSIDEFMAGVGLASAGAFVGSAALKGLATVGIGAGAVVAAPFLAKATVVTGVAVAAWGLGNLAWDASEGLRRRAGERLAGAREALTSARRSVASAGRDLVTGGGQVLAAAGGGLLRRVPGLGGG